MKFAQWTFASCVLISAFTSCGTGSSGTNPTAATGPFDSRGNYVEEWADNPSKWRRGGGSPSPHERRTDQLPEIAKIDQPPLTSVPLVVASASKPAVQAISQTQVISRTSSTAFPASQKPTQVTNRTADRPTVRTIARTTTKPSIKSSQRVVKAKPKVKIKAKPKSTRYLVKKGDSLSIIANRLGTSVSAIKSQNRISGSVIRPGQSLVIPRR